MRLRIDQRGNRSNSFPVDVIGGSPTRSGNDEEMQERPKASLSCGEARRDHPVRSPDFFKKMYDRTSALGKIGVWECDLATEELTWTDAVYDLFDLPRQSFVSRAATLACYEPDSRKKMDSLRAKAISTCSTFTVDVEICTALGNRRWIRINGDVEQEDGRAVRIFGTKQDITLEKVAQLQVQALQSELIHLSRASAMDAMRSTLAHELNQPLTAIAIYVSTIRKIMGGEKVDHEAALEVLDGVERCAMRAGDIIRGVRNMTTGRRPQPITFDLEATIREGCMIALAGAPKDLRVSYNLEDGLQVIGDPVQIQQVVINLVRNACDALAGCKTKEILVSTRQRDARAQVCVRDSGPGIAPEVIETLFEAFISTKADGTGLGLAISRTIVEAHSGSLTATNNNIGEGAIFQFNLPIFAPVSGCA